MNLGDLTPREPTVKIKRRGGPGRPRAENPLVHVYELTDKAGKTLEFNLADTQPETLEYIRRCLRRVARWYDHAAPKIDFDLTNRVWQLTVRPRRVTEAADPLPTEDAPE